MGSDCVCGSGRRVEVRFKCNGLDAIEVIDNGDGISPDNYESIGKGYTFTCFFISNFILFYFMIYIYAYISLVGGLVC